MHQRIMVYLLHGLFDDEDAEDRLLNLLDCMAMLYAEEVSMAVPRLFYDYEVSHNLLFKEFQV